MPQPFEQPSMAGGRAPPAEEPRGLIVVDKPQGITSRRALNIVEQRLGLGPLGHCGSLDPLATGVLVLVVGKARKVQDLIVRGEKVYDMTVTLGARSDTDDAEGVVTPVEDAQAPTREAVEPRCSRSRRDQPGAAHVQRGQGRWAAHASRGAQGPAGGGPAAHGHGARAAPRPLQDGELDLHLRCTSGTYARGIARDLGAALATGGYCRAWCARASARWTWRRPCRPTVWRSRTSRASSRRCASSAHQRAAAAAQRLVRGQIAAHAAGLRAGRSRASPGARARCWRRSPSWKAAPPTARRSCWSEARPASRAALVGGSPVRSRR